MTSDHQGISNVEVRLRFRLTDQFADMTREIGSIKTDANGFYSMSMYLRDNEIAEKSHRLKLLVNPADWNEQISNFTNEKRRGSSYGLGQFTDYCTRE